MVFPSGFFSAGDFLLVVLLWWLFLAVVFWSQKAQLGMLACLLG